MRFTVYGLPDGKRYALESSVTERVAPPPEKIIEGDEEKTVRAEKEGIASESYLCVYEGERLVSRTLFRRGAGNKAGQKTRTKRTNAAFVCRYGAKRRKKSENAMKMS